MQVFEVWKRETILLVFAALGIFSGPALSQINNPAYADYFLVGRFGEICTMCEAIVLCEAGDSDTQYEGIPEDRSFTLYHLQTRTFWSQVATALRIGSQCGAAQRQTACTFRLLPDSSRRSLFLSRTACLVLRPEEVPLGCTRLRVFQQPASAAPLPFYPGLVGIT